MDEAIGIEKIEQAIVNSPAVLAAVMERAAEARQFWVDYWEAFDHPYSRTHTLRSGYVENPGDYANSIRVKFMRTPEGAPMARITAHDYKAHWIEYGSAHMPEFACRAATVAHFGGTGKSISS
ncbi:hypothetical protein H7K45_20785 [Mycobacterium yunnanensis]|uniref:Uncharacterized protein n=1 Tax=Mycobacterium yunnanensis TaxID=368477 RepID=A0A9X3C2N2_9MYCO|nr:hypothetical protein [Mycobacterium yunnanensis]